MRQLTTRATIKARVAIKGHIHLTGQTVLGSASHPVCHLRLGRPFSLSSSRHLLSPSSPFPPASKSTLCAHSGSAPHESSDPSTMTFRSKMARRLGDPVSSFCQGTASSLLSGRRQATLPQLIRKLTMAPNSAPLLSRIFPVSCLPSPIPRPLELCCCGKTAMDND